jgi:hypothetical protein
MSTKDNKVPKYSHNGPPPRESRVFTTRLHINVLFVGSFILQEYAWGFAPRLQEFTVYEAVCYHSTHALTAWPPIMSEKLVEFNRALTAALLTWD